ncbi:Dephospho-CoA kinase [Marinobacter litoralis]|uniref:Dephospho-CoA kinase n=1 Tax=Marinobacter litoralis TaxID=187981 RepID=A0A3M2RFF4_9GAMM|nr:dephospho-CoA kinase [Marinobacter litoralis]RMJ03958.1 Dephospho-CoA kinase [Marinobacter litoralis]
MAIVGLTGGIGSGKSTVVRLFGELGVHWVDADDVAREVVEPGMPALTAIAEHFGDEVLLADGALDRAWLRQKVFAEPAERAWLEALLHPIIRDEIIRQLQPANYTLPYTLLVSPLLLETDQHELANKILVIDVPESVQLERTMARDNNSREQVERIMAAQMAREDRCAKADAIIDNNQPLVEVERQVAELHNQWMLEFS